MRKVILIPDSFKGTLSSATAGAIMAEQVRRFFPAAERIVIPVADGGEGTVAAFLAAVGGEAIEFVGQDPYGVPLTSTYAILPDGAAVVELAASAGLTLIDEAERNPELTTTYGVGMQIRDAIERGCRRILVGLGGSATNDLGVGAAAACGLKFYDADGREFLPTGGNLERIARIDAAAARRLLDGVEVVAICDITNPLYGESGAAYVFAPQKGADPEMVARLDRNLRWAADVIKRELGIDIAAMPGAGAAGGAGGGLAAFFGAELRSGIDVLLDTVGFDDLLTDCDAVFTGEGRVDGQTLGGKAVLGVARRSKARGVPVIVVAGDLPEISATETADAEVGLEALYEAGVTAMFSINRQARDFVAVRHKSASNLAATMAAILRVWQIVSSGQGN
ncbi:MAG: glycerate kinase [Clostridiaceae bacterium]|nr:glycerate kinase [Clostridiaceae bacterium]